MLQHRMPLGRLISFMALLVMPALAAKQLYSLHNSRSLEAQFLKRHAPPLLPPEPVSCSALAARLSDKPLHPLHAAAIKYKTFPLQDYDICYRPADFVLDAPLLYNGVRGDDATGYSGAVTLIGYYDMGAIYPMSAVSVVSHGSRAALYASDDGETWWGPYPLNDSGMTLLPGVYASARYYQVATSYSHMTDLRFYDAYGQQVLPPIKAPVAARNLKASRVFW